MSIYGSVAVVAFTSNRHMQMCTKMAASGFVTSREKASLDLFRYFRCTVVRLRRTGSKRVWPCEKFSQEKIFVKFLILSFHW